MNEMDKTDEKMEENTDWNSPQESLEALKKKLTPLLVDAGAALGTFSIGTPKKEAMCLIPSDGGWQVFFQEDEGEYAPTFFTRLAPAVYELATRLVATQAAHEIADKFE